MAIINAAVTAKFQGTIVVPLFKPPWFPPLNIPVLSAGSFYAASIFRVPGSVLSSTTVLTSYLAELYTPLTKRVTRKTSTTVGGTASQFDNFFSNNYYVGVNNTPASPKPMLVPRVPGLFVADIVLPTIPSDFMVYNTLPNTFPFGALSSQDGACLTLWDGGKLVAGYHWWNGSGNSVISWVTSTGLIGRQATTWLFNQNPGVVLANTVEPGGVGNCMTINTLGANGVATMALFRNFGADMIKMSVSWDDASLQAALNFSNIQPQSTAFGTLLGSHTDWNEQGSTWVLLSPDCTKYYRIKFTNGGGLAEITTAIGNNYSPKIDALGAFYLARPLTAAIYTSSALALPSLQVPTGGIVPFSLPCWSPCIPPQFLGGS